VVSFKDRDAGLSLTVVSTVIYVLDKSSSISVQLFVSITALSYGGGVEQLERKVS
jgi:hypothetical protein